MTDQGSRMGRWGIVAAMVVGACGSVGGGAGARDEAIISAIGDFWDGVEVPAAAPYLFGYDYQTHPSTRSCQHLAEDDRWYAERSSQIGSDVLTQTTLHQAALDYFERNGFRVDRWKTSSPDAPVGLGLIARKDETAIKISIETNGSSLLSVRMGPCATPTMDGFSQPPYEPVE